MMIDEVDRAMERHRSLMLVASLLGAATFSMVWAPSLEVQLVILGAGVAVFGIPHGALDHHAGRNLLFPIAGRWWWLAFGVLYLGAMLVVAGGWLLTPRAMLIAFLGLSTLHFGLDDPHWRRVSGRRLDLAERLAVGSLPIVIPCLVHTSSVTPIFNWLLPSRVALEASSVALTAAAAALVAIPLLLNRTVRLFAEGDRNARLAASESLAVAALFSFAPPLLAFALYFCGWHSTRHIIELASQLDDPTERSRLIRFVRASAPLTVVTLAGAGIVAATLLSNGFPVNESIGRVVFIGLSALTLPHVFLLAASRLSLDTATKSVSLSEVVVNR